MAKNSEKTMAYDPIKPFLVDRVADMKGVSKRYIYMVLSGDREDEEILTCYMTLLEGANNLLEQVKTAVPL